MDGPVDGGHGHGLVREGLALGDQLELDPNLDLAGYVTTTAFSDQRMRSRGPLTQSLGVKRLRSRCDQLTRDRRGSTATTGARSSTRKNLFKAQQNSNL